MNPPVGRFGQKKNKKKQGGKKKKKKTSQTPDIFKAAPLQKKKPIALHNMPSTSSRYEFHWAADSSVGDITGAVNLNKMSAGVLRQRSLVPAISPGIKLPCSVFPQSSEKAEKYQRIILLVFSLQCLVRDRALFNMEVPSLSLVLFVFRF